MGRAAAARTTLKQLQSANMFGALVWTLPENQQRHPAFVRRAAERRELGVHHLRPEEPAEDARRHEVLPAGGPGPSAPAWPSRSSTPCSATLPIDPGAHLRHRPLDGRRRHLAHDRPPPALLRGGRAGVRPPASGDRGEGQGRADLELPWRGGRDRTRHDLARDDRRASARSAAGRATPSTPAWATTCSCGPTPSRRSSSGCSRRSGDGARAAPPRTRTRSVARQRSRE